MVIEAMVAEAPWVKSKHGGPHEYVLYWQAPDLFKQIQALLKTQAVKKRFGASIYKYLNMDGWRYWTMYPVLNRAEGEIEDE